MALDKLIAFHCGPALTGIKPSNLLAVKVPNEEAAAKADILNKQCNKNGIFFNTMNISKKTTLFFVYNKPLLKKTLKNPGAVLFLLKEGYTPLKSIDEHIKRLGMRIKEASARNMGFPHEIGIFLGYPLEDVKGFITHKGKNCKMCGYWKVYGDEKKAGALFRRYTECREICFRKAAEGLALSEICEYCNKNRTTG